MTMQVVGLTGFAGAGKSTVANYLVEEHGFTRLSFAAPLKKMLRTLNPVMGSSRVYSGLSATGSSRPVHLDEVFNKFQGDELAVKASRYGDEYRRLLQVLGTDCIRSVDEHFWVKAALAQMPAAFGKYVFDDCRFPNEAEVISEMNPFGLWNVTRPGFEAVNGHDSEKWAGSMGEKIWLHNASDLEVLYDQIDSALDIAFESKMLVR
jgi:hypothetical protein